MRPCARDHSRVDFYIDARKGLDANPESQSRVSTTNALSVFSSCARALGLGSVSCFSFVSVFQWFVQLGLPAVALSNRTRHC